MADRRRLRRIRQNAEHATVINVETSSSSDSEGPFCPPAVRRQRVEVGVAEIESEESNTSSSSPTDLDLSVDPTGETGHVDHSTDEQPGTEHADSSDSFHEGSHRGAVGPALDPPDIPPLEINDSEAEGSQASVGSLTLTESDFEDNASDAAESDFEGSGNETAESDFEDSESEAEEVEGDQPLYPGAPLTVGASLLAIMTLTLTHGLTGQCLCDLLKLIALHCPGGNLCKTTLYKFKKYFSDIGQSLLVFHYYCSECIFPLLSKDSVCHLCQGEHRVTYFIELPILFQLQAMFMRPNFLEDLQFRFRRHKKNLNNIEDIYDGRIYKEHFSRGFLSNPHNLSFMWYSDGISIFKSSKFSIWPLYLIINELSYKKRVKKENIILAGLWFGASKPSPNVFLAPFHASLSQLSTVGHHFNVPNQQPILVKGMLLCGTCDLPAKSLFLKFKQYNAYYGCASCKSKGVRHGVGNTSVHVHPYNQMIERRNHDEVSVFANMAHETGKSVMGIKGLSTLYFMVPDIIKCNALDAMHGIFSGVCKLLTHLWFDSTYAQSRFSISGLVDIVDRRLLRLRPPSFVQRMPRSIKHTLNLWKAAEYKLWMLYYSIPVLTGIMDDEYLSHHVCFVSAISLLTQESISPEHVEIASNLLHSYVRVFQELYGLRYVGMNVHQLLHFPELVLDLGPLWVYSCFFLEDMNGKLGKLFHGNAHVGIQICSVASTYLNLNVMIDKLPASPVRSFCERLTSGRKSVKIAEQVVIGHSSYYAVGKFVHIPLLPPLIRVAMMNSLQILDGNFQLFYRLRKKGIIYFSEGYMKSNKKLSTFVSYTSNNISKLCCVNYFIRRSDCQCNNICQCPASYFVIGTIYDRLPWLVHNIQNVRMSYLSKVIRTEETVAFPVEALDCLCFYMKVDEEEYIGKPVNQIESE